MSVEHENAVIGETYLKVKNATREIAKLDMEASSLADFYAGLANALKTAPGSISFEGESFQGDQVFHVDPDKLDAHRLRRLVTESRKQRSQKDEAEKLLKQYN